MIGQRRMQKKSDVSLGVEKPKASAPTKKVRDDGSMEALLAPEEDEGDMEWHYPLWVFYFSSLYMMRKVAWDNENTEAGDGVIIWFTNPGLLIFHLLGVVVCSAFYGRIFGRISYSSVMLPLSAVYDFVFTIAIFVVNLYLDYNRSWVTKYHEARKDMSGGNGLELRVVDAEAFNYELRVSLVLVMVFFVISAIDIGKLWNRVYAAIRGTTTLVVEDEMEECELDLHDDAEKLA